jgi:hypothetical protein
MGKVERECGFGRAGSYDPSKSAIESDPLKVATDSARPDNEARAFPSESHTEMGTPCRNGVSVIPNLA